jgi:hypothetical protein
MGCNVHGFFTCPVRKNKTKQKNKKTKKQKTKNKKQNFRIGLAADRADPYGLFGTTRRA